MSNGFCVTIYMNKFDAIVVGGGHAGLEALRALNQRAFRVALVTLDQSKCGVMSCNPAIGGVAKSHLVFEIDALGGLMGGLADENAIQSRRLNMKKGPAVRATRVQCDKARYRKSACREVANMINVEVISSECSTLLISPNQKISGIKLKDGSTIYARAVVITAGTFMRGVMFCGEQRQVGGRFGDRASNSLTESLLDCGHSTCRLKTGTPARLDAKSINFKVLQKQWGDGKQRQFSWKRAPLRLPQVPCFLTYSNERTHQIISENFHKSPLFSGEIQGVGPRYCPSVEDKIKRFPDRKRHQIFLEPEGLDTNYVYPNGISTSLPVEVQQQFLSSIVGMERVKIIRPGYAVEYDTMNPTELNSSLMSRNVEGLFFAGQVNRTSGYEEAAAQGLWAGIQAGQLLSGADFVQIDRSRSYMETLVDDIVSKESREPYRLFTSRSEYRLLLREDNAAERLHDLALELALLSREQQEHYALMQEQMSKSKKSLKSKRIRVSMDKVISYEEYLKRPEVSWESIVDNFDEDEQLDHFSLAAEKLEVEVKYEGYIRRQLRDVELLRQSQQTSIEDIDFTKISELSSEEREKIASFKPKTLKELLSISGVTPAAAVAILQKRSKDLRREGPSKDH